MRVAADGDEFVESVLPATAAGGRGRLGGRPTRPTVRALRCRPRSRAGSARARCALRRGVLVVVDYAATGAELVERGEAGWLRTYREHDRGVAPLAAPGEQDITIDVPHEYLVHAAARAGFQLELDITQAEWLRGLGIDDLVAEARDAVGRPRPRR